MSRNEKNIKLSSIIFLEYFVFVVGGSDVCVCVFNLILYDSPVIIDISFVIVKARLNLLQNIW